MAIKTAAELKAYFETGDTPTQAQFVDLIDTIFSAVPNYKIYRALLNQSGTDAPVATVLENTLGGTVVWTRQSAGVYIGTLIAAFPVAKTGVLGSKKYINMERSSDDAVIVNTYDTDDVTPFDDILGNTYIEIIVYN